MKLTGADIVVKTLIEQGCEVVFGYPGGQIIDVYDSLYKYKGELKHILTAHEQGAAHAADGYARASGKPGVVIATSGPGAANLVTGIATAHLDSVPLIAITGNVMTSQISTDSFQEVDITGVTLPITKHNYFVERVEDLADTIREAFVLAVSGRPGPVLIDIPKDVQMAECEFVPGGKTVPEEKFPAKELRIAQAVKTIETSVRPYIYFGGGVIASGAQEEMIALADRLDAVMGCSLMGISAIPTNQPRFLGMQGMYGHYASGKALSEADCIIALGVRFNDRVTGDREKFAENKKIIHIDIDGSELSKNITTTHGLRGDIKLTLSKLLPLLKEKKHPKWQHRIEILKQEEETYQDKRQGMTPRNIIRKLNGFLKPEMPVATDVGQHQMWAAQNLIFTKSRKFISSGGLGTMGFGMGAAMGSQLVTKEHAVLLTGDGSFGMNLNELATAVSNRIPLVILIFNNGVLGMVRQMQTTFYEKHYSETVLDRKTDFVKVAQAFGAEGVRAENTEELEKALQQAFDYQGPFVIDCMIDKDEFVFPVIPQFETIEQVQVSPEKK